MPSSVAPRGRGRSGESPATTVQRLVAGPRDKEVLTIRRRKRFFREPPPKPLHRINERINLSPVRLIGPDGSQIGVVPVEEARALAEENELDLVEVAPNSRPIVCRIMDYGRFLYEQQKRAKEAKGSRTEIKEVKVRPNIDDNDFNTKIGMARRFLEAGKLVKFTVMFRRREMRRPESGYELLKRAMETLGGVAQIERGAPPELLGRDLSMVFRPSSSSASSATSTSAESS